MCPLRFTIGRLLLIVAAFSVGFSALQGNHVWFLGMSVMTLVGLLGAAIGAGPGPSRPGPSSPLL